MQENNERAANVANLRQFAAVPVPEHFQRQVQDFVEHLMDEESGGGSYNRFLETILGGTDTGNREVISSPETGTTGGVVLEILYD